MRKQHILYIVAITILFSLMITIDNNSYINSNNNVSALDYSSNVGIGFTFNPTLSINVSSSDLVISNLKPGTTEDSNSINVSISSNNANGYMMFATVGNKKYNNANLSHSNTIDSFSSITTNANLASLTTDDTWGYSYSTDHGLSWSNYNGLPLYSSSGATLINKLGPAESDIDFKIAARASNTQASGAYENVINFIAITRSNPVSLEDAYNSYYLSTGKTKHNGYYVMQDMNSTICNNVELPDSELQVIDIRDDKVYWIAKLRDGNCWMTQNLDLDLISDPRIENYVPLTSENTDLNDNSSQAYQEGYLTDDKSIRWLPSVTTIHFNETNLKGWSDVHWYPRSATPDARYVYPSNLGSTDAIYNSFQSCSVYHEDCSHYSVGNYYNWTAAIASNNSESFSNVYENANNSICPAGWRLPVGIDRNGTNREYGALLTSYGIIGSAISTKYVDDGFVRIRSLPLYFARGGMVYNGSLGEAGYYWTSTINSSNYAYVFLFNDSSIYTAAAGGTGYRMRGFSVRCLARQESDN